MESEDLQRVVGTLEGKMDMLIHEVRAANKAHISVSAALSNRLRKVEKWQTRVVAWSAGVAFAVSLGFRYLFRDFR